MKIKFFTPEYKSNLFAQALSFVINISLFALTHSYLWIWVELASLAFLSVYNAPSRTFFDRNIFNHFISVMIYYLLSLWIGNNHYLYFTLIFVFTYVFFVLKNNGYTQSLNLWMYLQALLIGTTFLGYPFFNKIVATLIGYLEAQVLLNLAFYCLKATEKHEEELVYLDVLKLPFSVWWDLSRIEVRLAIRGSITAALLYIVCTNWHDVKPNWAVVSAIACLLRDDYYASMRAIIGVTIGSILAWPIGSWLIAHLGINTEISTVLLWCFMLLGLMFGAELRLRPSLVVQILSSGLLLLAVTCVAISLQISNSYQYLELKVVNSLIGVSVAFLVLHIWQLIQDKKI